MRAAASLLPSARAPAIVHARRPHGADASRRPADDRRAAAPRRGAFGSCRRARAGRSFTAARPPRAGTVRTTLLGNRAPHPRGARLPQGRRQHLRAPDARRPDAEGSRRARSPQSVGLVRARRRAPAQAVLEALLAATLAHAFALPSLRSAGARCAPHRPRHALRRPTASTHATRPPSPAAPISCAG